MYSLQDTRRNESVSTFGTLLVKVSLPTYRSLSQATTSFIALCRQGIHHMRLVTWSYNLKRSRTCGSCKQPVVYLVLKYKVFLLQNTVFDYNLIVKER